MKFRIPFIPLVLSCSPALAQVSPCGINHHLEESFENHPEWRAIYEKDQLNFKSHYEEFAASWSPDDRSTYVIPVVVHIIHDGGLENISDEQVYDAIKQLNEDFSATNEDVVEAVSPFNAIIGEMDIEFRLAGKDYLGNCTEGITRTFSDLTYGGDGDAVADLVEMEQGSWPQNRYLNIFVMADLGGPAGYTNYPDTWYPVDGMYGGIYMLHDYMGSIGTSEGYHEHTLSHEAGHWLNLMHTWGSTNSPGDPDNCFIDDDVMDTPNTMGWSFCNLSGASCGSPIDNVQNFMEYAYCGCMFTDGQVIRSQAALNSSVAGRNNLWTPANLLNTGTNGILCAADFESDNNLICTGSQIQFSDESYHQETSRVWTFEGGSPGVSTDENPLVTYNTPGSFNVTLQAFNGAESISETKWDYISVFDASGNDLPYMQGFESLGSLFDANSFAVNNANGGETWEISMAYAHLSTRSAWLKNFGNDDGSIDDLISETIDLSTVPVTEDLVMSFDYSYNKRYAANDEHLKVFISDDCGESWTLRLSLDSDDMTETILSGPYFPMFDDWWRTEILTNINSPYYVENFMYKFEFTNGNGNNLFLDNINIYPASMSDVVESESRMHFRVYPNPAELHISLEGISSVNYSISDMTGRMVLSGTYVGDISIADLAPGIYQIQVTETDGALVGVRQFVRK